MNTLQNNGGAAFPQPQGTFNGTPYSSREVEGDSGMTLRDYFAGQAVSGLYADAKYTGSHVEAAKCCYDLADAMLAERNRL
jgi:hypothetical protein